MKLRIRSYVAQPEVDAIETLNIAAKAIKVALVEARAGRIDGVEKAAGKAASNLNALRNACRDERYLRLPESDRRQLDDDAAEGT